MAEDPQFYDSSFGGLRLWLTRLSTDNSRNVVVHELSTGDEHSVQDRGKGSLRATATVLFAWMVGDELAPLERLRRLKALVDDKPRMLSHPVEGSYLARVGPFQYEIDEHGLMSAEVEFIAAEEVRAISPAGAGGIPASGEGAVTAAAEVLKLELAEVAIESAIPDEAIAAADGWSSSEDLSPRAVFAETGSLTEQLGDLAQDLEVALDTWEAFKATVILAESVRAAAEAATAESSQTFAMRIGTPIALRALLASLYGADESDERYLQVMRLNDIATPAWLEPGSELQLPVLRPTARSG